MSEESCLMPKARCFLAKRSAKKTKNISAPAATITKSTESSYFKKYIAVSISNSKKKTTPENKRVLSFLGRSLLKLEALSENSKEKPFSSTTF